jgi:tetratricopeptide (TPR) repeat protein
VTQEPLEAVQIAYQAGQFAFEQGRYRESVQYLEQARQAVELNSPLGGEIQMWLVTAFEASGKRQEAIALCKQLTRHPNIGTRQQARRLSPGSS